MTARSVPTVRELDRDEVEAVLSRNHVGRIAYGRGSRIDIEPIHYVYEDGWIYGRTSHGARLETAGFSWWPVAVEVDEMGDAASWRSVVVHGGFYTLPDQGAEREQGLRVLRGHVPDADEADASAPMRHVLFRIAVDEAAGRESVRAAVPAAEPVPA